MVDGVRSTLQVTLDRDGLPMINQLYGPCNQPSSTGTWDKVESALARGTSRREEARAQERAAELKAEMGGDATVYTETGLVLDDVEGRLSKQPRQRAEEIVAQILEGDGQNLDEIVRNLTAEEKDATVGLITDILDHGDEAQAAGAAIDLEEEIPF